MNFAFNPLIPSKYWRGFQWIFNLTPESSKWIASCGSRCLSPLSLSIWEIASNFAGSKGFPINSLLFCFNGFELLRTNFYINNWWKSCKKPQREKGLLIFIEEYKMTSLQRESMKSSVNFTSLNISRGWVWKNVILSIILIMLIKFLMKTQFFIY